MASRSHPARSPAEARWPAHPGAIYLEEAVPQQPRRAAGVGERRKGEAGRLAGQARLEAQVQRGYLRRRGRVGDTALYCPESIVLREHTAPRV